ncbi:hypothetical protein [Streptosporangium sp. 'caverna']|nr:hypothetical protein [Streptosporangium sp. 'caverna']
MPYNRPLARAVADVRHFSPLSKTDEKEDSGGEKSGFDEQDKADRRTLT